MVPIPIPVEDSSLLIIQLAIFLVILGKKEWGGICNYQFTFKPGSDCYKSFRPFYSWFTWQSENNLVQELGRLRCSALMQGAYRSKLKPPNQLTDTPGAAPIRSNMFRILNQDDYDFDYASTFTIANEKQVCKETEVNARTSEKATIKQAALWLRWTTEMEEWLVELRQQNDCLFNVSSTNKEKSWGEIASVLNISGDCRKLLAQWANMLTVLPNNGTFYPLRLCMMQPDHLGF